MTPSELTQVFSSKSVTIVPSVYDTLNFVALESLFSGCPTVIGSGAGVCRYLCERFPGLRFEVINVDNWYECVPRLEAILRNYRDYRRRLQEAVAAEDLQPHGLKLTDVYQARPAYDPVLRACHRLVRALSRAQGCLAGDRTACVVPEAGKSAVRRPAGIVDEGGKACRHR